MEKAIIGKTWRYIYWVDENGILRENNRPDGIKTYGDRWLAPEFEKFCKSKGYVDPAKSIPSIISRFYVGKSVSSLINHIERTGIERRERERERTAYKKKPRIYIGVDKREIDFYEEGFSVFVLLNSGYSYSEQCEFVKTNIDFLHREICETFGALKAGRAKKAFDLIPFCDVVDVVVSRKNEVRVTYELKSRLKAVM